MNGAFLPEAATAAPDAADLPAIREAGELIVATLTGPDTYFEYRGEPMGVQYALCAAFARSEGVRLRVEVLRDTAAVLSAVRCGEADIAALFLPPAAVRRAELSPAGAGDGRGGIWAVRNQAVGLQQALRGWSVAGVVAQAQRTEQQRLQARQSVRRRVRAPYVSRERGIISPYDDHLRAAARLTGWDWRLLAAQCYQESGFDPQAVSSAGARGLMQIMPATAQHLGIAPSQLYTPADNIAGAGRYLRELTGYFSDVRSRAERVKFVLAAYNGGHGHIRDAMALARRDGRDAQRWSECAPYVLGLSTPRYYRDPLVRCGYMIGSETVAYVDAVLSRARAYGARVEMDASPLAPAAGDGAGVAARPYKRNRFTKNRAILSPEELSRQ